MREFYILESGRNIVDAAVSEYSSYCRRSITKAKGTTLTSPNRALGWFPSGGWKAAAFIIIFSPALATPTTDHNPLGFEIHFRSWR